MQTKSRKLNKAELELWKLVTKNDKILGNYTKALDKNSTITKKKEAPVKKEKNEKLDVRKNNFLTKNIQKSDELTRRGDFNKKSSLPDFFELYKNLIYQIFFR